MCWGGSSIRIRVNRVRLKIVCSLTSSGSRFCKRQLKEKSKKDGRGEKARQAKRIVIENRRPPSPLRHCRCIIVDVIVIFVVVVFIVVVVVIVVVVRIRCRRRCVVVTISASAADSIVAAF